MISKLAARAIIVVIRVSVCGLALVVRILCYSYYDYEKVESTYSYVYGELFCQRNRIKAIRNFVVRIHGKSAKQGHGLDSQEIGIIMVSP
jgi:hypothetical protein